MKLKKSNQILIIFIALSSVIVVIIILKKCRDTAFINGNPKNPIVQHAYIPQVPFSSINMAFDYSHPHFRVKDFSHLY
jgi:hypothetical protein